MFEHIETLTDAERKQLKRNIKYWGDRAARTQEAITEKTEKEIMGQLRKYYAKAQSNVIEQFKLTYDKVRLTISEGGNPTPADLYKLDSYWKMQSQVAEELRKLGYRQAAVLNAKFINQFEEIYFSLAEISNLHYTEIDTKVVEQLINNIWCADGLSWEQRIWKNNELLQQALNDNLLDCVITGKSSQDLKLLLQEQFTMSYERADTLVRTELSQIQTQAAKKRYEDLGLTEVEVWASEDERRCKVCGKLHEQRFPIHGKIPIPAHPRCRCCILPVVD